MTAPAPATVGSSWADVPFGEFLHLLRRNGFAVGLQHYARMMTLLDALGPDCAPVRVRSMLAPVFATTPDQQDRFYRLFDQWFPVFVIGTTDAPRAMGGDPQDADPSMPAPGSRRGVRRKKQLLPIAAAMAATLLVVILLWWATRPGAPVPGEVTTPTPPAPTEPLPAPQAAPVPVSPTEAAPDEREVNWQAVRIAVALLVLLGFVLNEWRHYRRRRMVVERQRRERPPLVWPIRVDAASTPLVESSEFLTAARRLRERQTGDRERLDIEATISATIRALGRPVLQYVKETRPPEYLILIERSSARDHQARLFQHLIEHLAAEGVHATVYWCEEDPRICDPVVEGPTATLVELRHKFPSHRLLMFGTGDGLIDPISGRRKAWMSDALSWPDRALLTPETPESWGARELALAGHMIVLPSTLAGLQAAIDHFQIPSRRDVLGRRHRAAPVPEPDPRDAVRVIKGYLGPRGLQWVCACAVYPDLQWHLTLHLGMLPELGGRIDEELLVKLVRLPWFRQGAIPDEARAVLLRVIETEVERAARRTIIALLERNPAPPETIASSRFQLDLVVQKFALNSKVRANRRDLAKVARHAPRDRVLSELAVLRLTEGDTAPAAMRVPERLRDIFFQGGVSILGLTSGARSVVAMALVAGVLFLGPGQALSSDESVAEAPADSAQRGPQVGVTTPADTSGVPSATPPPVSDTGRAATLPPANVTADAPLSLLTPAEQLSRAESAFRSRNYGSADSIAQQLMRGSALVGAEQIRLLTLAGAAAFPQSGAQDRARAVEAIRFLLDANPSFRFPADMTWPGLDQLLEEQRAARIAATRAATVGVIQIGSGSPNTVLYINGAVEGPIGPVRSIQLPGGEAVRLSIRLVGCGGAGWDTTVAVPAGDTLALGLRETSCTAVIPTPAPAAPDPAVIDRLIDHARSESLSRLQGPWTTLNKAPRVTFGSPADQQRLAGGVREGTLVGTVRTIGTRTAGGPPVTEDSVFLTADVRFAWRIFVGANQANDATIELVFERTSGTPQLRRMHIVLRTAR